MIVVLLVNTDVPIKVVVTLSTPTDALSNSIQVRGPSQTAPMINTWLVYCHSVRRPLWRQAQHPQILSDRSLVGITWQRPSVIGARTDDYVRKIIDQHHSSYSLRDMDRHRGFTPELSRHMEASTWHRSAGSRDATVYSVVSWEVFSERSLPTQWTYWADNARRTRCWLSKHLSIQSRLPVTVE